MTLEDLVIPPGPSPLAERATQRTHPDAAAVYKRMETCARFLALSLIATRAGSGEDMDHRHTYANELARAEFDHMKITEGATIRDRMISKQDRELIYARALAITEHHTENHQ